jgi:hypothetical protein
MLIPNRARSYYYDESQQLFANAVLTDTVLGSTNVYSNIEDIVLWHENYYSGKVGGLELIDEMHQPGKLNNGKELNYASGLVVGQRYQSFYYVEHGGGQAGYVCWTIRIPDLRVSVILMCNQFLWELRNLAFQVVDQLLPTRTSGARIEEPGSSLEEKPATIDLAVDELQLMAGTYINSESGAIREVNVDKDSLKILDLVLAPVSHNEFVYEAFPTARATFVGSSGEAPEELHIVSESSSTRYLRADGEKSSSIDLPDYAGTYYSPELDLYWNVNIHENQLAVSRRKYGTTLLTAISGDNFKDDWSPFSDWPTEGLIAFSRDRNKDVVGFKVSCERLRGLRFSRQGQPGS